MAFILITILSLIPAFLLTWALFGFRTTSKKSDWLFYYLAAVIAVIVNPILTIMGVVLVGVIFSLPDMEYIGWVMGPLGGSGIIAGVLGGTAAIVLRLRNQ